jgi:hypothetical protein
MDMSSENAPSAPVTRPGLWLENLGLSGKILGIGAVLGIIVSFLPLISVSIDMGIMKSRQSALVVQDWRGVICLLGYAGALALVFFLYPPSGLDQKGLAWAAVGVGGLVTLLALWLFMLAISGSSNMAIFGSLKVTPGIGAFLNVLTAGAVAAGGFLKAREEKLF